MISLPNKLLRFFLWMFKQLNQNHQNSSLWKCRFHFLVIFKVWCLTSQEHDDILIITLHGQIGTLGVCGGRWLWLSDHVGAWRFWFWCLCRRAVSWSLDASLVAVWQFVGGERRKRCVQSDLRLQDAAGGNISKHLEPIRRLRCVTSRFFTDSQFSL